MTTARHLLDPLAGELSVESPSKFGPEKREQGTEARARSVDGHDPPVACAPRAEQNVESEHPFQQRRPGQARRAGRRWQTRSHKVAHSVMLNAQIA